MEREDPARTACAVFFIDEVVRADVAGRAGNDSADGAAARRRGAVDALAVAALGEVGGACMGKRSWHVGHR